MVKLGIIYGGISTEHEISIKSAQSIIKNLDKEKYEINQIFIDKEGTWYEERNSAKIKIENTIKYLKKLDIVFPVLHGLYGEDGTIQGFFELFNIKYVGCKVLSSSIGMDKAYSKIIFEKAKINQTKYLYIKKYEKNKYIYINEDLSESILNLEELVKITEKKLKYPMFVKPSNSGSSVGVNKAKDQNELIKNIENASNYDKKILIEEGIEGREIECAVLGNSMLGVEVTDPGEIIPAGEYYSFDSKYKMKESKILIPASLTEKEKEEIKEIAKKAFLAIDGNGLSRIDFFIENDTKKIYINEINTMPGFTEISMFPKLFENYGYTYSEILDKIIEINLK